MEGDRLLRFSKWRRRFALSVLLALLATVLIAHSSQAQEATVQTAPRTETVLWFPIVNKAMFVPVISGVPHPSAANKWTVSWTQKGSASVTFELQESQSPSFSSVTTYNTGTTRSQLITHAASTGNLYYYRVRAWGGAVSSSWSNTIRVVGGYYDDFSSAATNWRIVRQDTDDTNNSSWYEDGKFVLRVGGRWDYAIGSGLGAAPSPPYEIKARIKLHEADNLNAAGIIFGGDWNGAYCPAADYSSCFNHYYRLSVIWFDDENGKLRVQLKRIDWHDVDNVGRGVTLFGPVDVQVGAPSSDWNEWTVKVYANGLIRVYVDGNRLAGEAVDTTYLNHPYFGGFGATDEYLGARPYYDWFKATALD